MHLSGIHKTSDEKYLITNKVLLYKISMCKSMKCIRSISNHEGILTGTLQGILEGSGSVYKYLPDYGNSYSCIPGLSDIRI